MMPKTINGSTPKFFIPTILAAAGVPGAAFGAFAYHYWFIDSFPPNSARALLLTTALTLAAWAVYAWGAWVIIRRPAHTELQKTWRYVLAGAGTGALLFFAGTQPWLLPNRYLHALLPDHALEIRVVDAPAQTDALSVQWLTTSLGDISLKSIRAQGWQLAQDVLQVEPSQPDPVLAWRGKVGQSALILFRASHPTTIEITWDGQRETITLPAGDYAYSRSFTIPFLASHTALVLLGLLHFSLAAGAVGFLLARAGFSLEETPPWIPAKRLEAAAVLGILLLALALRLPLLGLLSPHGDEYSHMIAARQLLNSETVAYTRSFWTVTFPVALSFLVFGQNAWAAKIPGVLFNVLAILPLYALTRRISPAAALVSILLYATNPLVLSLSRWIREYAINPLLFYGVIWVMLKFMEEFQFWIKDWKARPRLRLFILGVVLLLPLVYAAIIDPRSTFKLIYLSYAALAFLIALPFIRMAGKKALLLLPLILLLGVIFFSLPFFRNIKPGFGPDILLYFFPNPPQQWYADRVSALPALALMLAVSLAFRQRKQHPEVLFFLLMFVPGILAFVFSSLPFRESRHLLFAQLWFIPLLGVGIASLIVHAGKLFTRPALKYGVWIALFLLSFNIHQTLLPVIGDDYLVTNTYRYNFAPAQALLLSESRPQDALLTTAAYMQFHTWEGQPAFSSATRLSTKRSAELPLTIASENPGGWVIIEDALLGQMQFDPDSYSRFTYRGNFGGFHIWRWDHAQP